MRFFVDKLVPKGYKPLTYLESSKTQYIDTGFIPNQDTRVVSVHEYVKDPANFGYVFGAGYTATDRAFEFYTWTSNWNSPYCNTNIIMSQPSSTLVVNNKIKIDKNKNVITITYFDGSTQTNSTDYADFTVTDRSLWLFAINRGSTAEMYKSDGVRLYSCKIWNKDILVRDFQPALRESDNKPGMYDRVNNVFYTNAGTSEFLYEEPAKESIEYITNPNYQQVEYLESTGTQYIDTGYIQNGIGLKADLVYTQLTTPTSEQAIIGRNGGNGYELYTQGAKFGLWNAPSKQVVTANTLTLNKLYHFIGEVSSTGINLNSDGTNYSWSGSTEAGTSPTTATVTIFNHNSNYYAIGRIYYCKLYDNGTLVRDFIPAIRKSDNEAGMYDKITGQFFTNAGTGEFLYGSLVGPLPAKYKELEYIESTGTQWIDTLFTCTSTDNYTISEDVQWTSWDNTFSAGYNSVEGETGVAQQLFFGPRGKNTTNKFYYGIEQGGVTYIENTYTGLNERHTYELIRRNGNSIVKKDGIELYNGEKIGPTVNNYRLFGCVLYEMNAGYAVNFMRNYGTKIIKNGIFIHDFVPCYKVSNGEAGLYDRVTGAFFANAGTGSFIKGEKGTTLRNEITRLVINNLAKTIDSYRRIDYLEGTGTQYIDTGVYGNLNTKIEAKVYSAKIDSTSGYCIAGDFTTSTKAITMPFNFSNSGLYSRFGDKSITGGIQQQDGTYTIAVDKDGYYVNGVKIADFNATTAFTTTNTMMLFGFTGLGRNYLVGKTYYCKIWDGDTLVRDFIPVLDQFNVPCMYDSVEKKLYYNQGTGTFGYGEVLPSNGTRIIRDLSDYSKEYTPLKYIQSTGTQYIDTGYSVSVNDNLDAQYDMIVTSIPNSRGLNGYSLAQAGFWGKTASDTYELGSSNTGIAIGNRDKIGFIREIITETRQDTDLYINGTVASHAQRSTTAETGPFQIFACNGAYKMSGKLYSATLKINGTLIRNFIPLLRKSDSKPGLYDRVNNVFYTNAGTDEFLYETA